MKRLQSIWTCRCRSYFYFSYHNITHTPSAPPPLGKSVQQCVAAGDAKGAYTLTMEYFNQHHHKNEVSIPYDALTAALHICYDQQEVHYMKEMIEKIMSLSIFQQPTNNNNEFSKQEKLFSMVLRFFIQEKNFEAAHHLFCYMEAQNKKNHTLSKLRNISPFLQFCCQLYGQKKQKSVRNAIIAIFNNTVQHSIKLTQDDFYYLGLFCLADEDSQSIAHFQYYLQHLQYSLQEIRYAPSNDNKKDSHFCLVREVLIPWAARVRLSASVLEITLCNNDNHHHNVCPCCQTPITAFPFTANQKNILLTDLKEKVIPQELNKRKHKNTKNIAQTKLNSFVHFINSFPPSHKIDLLIDGANVGYYGLSSWYGIAKEKKLKYYFQLLDRNNPNSELDHLSEREYQHLKKVKKAYEKFQIHPNESTINNNLYLQEVDFNAQRKLLQHHNNNNNMNNNKDQVPPRFAVDVGIDIKLLHSILQDALHEKKFKHPLIILQERHLLGFFTHKKNETNHNNNNYLWYTKEEYDIVQYWRQHHYCFATPSALNDDLYLLQAGLTLSETTEEEEQKQNKRYPRNVYLFTNDVLRDHFFKLMSPFYFAQWRDSRCIHFRCAYIENKEKGKEKKGETRVEWIFPPSAVRCIQEQKLTNHNHHYCSAWHIPLSSGQEDNVAETWLCLYPQEEKKQSS